MWMCLFVCTRWVSKINECPTCWTANINTRDECLRKRRERRTQTKHKHTPLDNIPGKQIKISSIYIMRGTKSYPCSITIHSWIHVIILITICMHIVGDSGFSRTCSYYRIHFLNSRCLKKEEEVILRFMFKDEWVWVWDLANISFTCSWN